MGKGTEERQTGKKGNGKEEITVKHQEKMERVKEKNKREKGEQQREMISTVNVE